MANELQTSIRAYTADDIQIKRFLRVDEARQLFQLEEEVLLIVAISALVAIIVMLLATDGVVANSFKNLIDSFFNRAASTITG